MTSQSRDALLTMDPDAQALLAEWLPGRCVVFRDQRLPADCRPSTARLGLEGHVSGGVSLLVDRGLAYAGGDPRVAMWISAGSESFPSLAEALDWFASVMAPPVPPRDSATSTPPRVTLRGPRAEDLTDLGAVEAVAPTVRPVEAAMLREWLHREVLGQHEVTGPLAEAIARHTAKVRPAHPFTALLAGPTGVGKTLTASTLAERLSEHETEPWQFVRLDMAEYSEAHSVARLHGAPPGYVGYGDEHSLAALLSSDRPAVVLFDEIDKAHPSVFRALLGLMDAGRLGGRASASPEAVARSILLFTSNARADELVDIVETVPLARRDAAVRGALRGAGMSPELLGRLGQVCVYRPLTAQDRAAIAVLAIARVAESYGLAARHISPEVVSEVLRRTSDDGLGARGLEHTIDRCLGPAFSRAAGGGDVRVSMREGLITVGPGPSDA